MSRFIKRRGFTYLTLRKGFPHKKRLNQRTFFRLLNATFKSSSAAARSVLTRAMRQRSEQKG